MRRLISFAITAAFFASAAGAQIVRPPRDRPNGPPPSVGTAAMSGRVVDAQTGNAVARARVRLNWMGPGVPRPPAITDTSGNFRFTDLPAGSLMLSAEKSTYLPGRYPEAGQTLRVTAQPVTLADGQTIDRIVIRMFHGGAITGHVIDANGDLLEMVQVQALRIPKSGGKPQPRFGGSTNDLGEFRVPRLEAGQYLLLAMPNHSFAPAGMEVPDLEPQAMPTFYPGALSMSQAQLITVVRGGTVAGIDLQVVDGQAASVSGMVVDLTGQPVAMVGSINVRPIVQDLPGMGMGFPMSGTGMKPDGTFKLTLPPGEYELEAHASSMRTSGPPAPGSELIGVVRVNVGGPVSGITIALGSAARVSGRLVFEGTAPVPAFSSLNGPATIAFTAVDGSSCRTGRSELAPDWTFTVEGISGTCLARFYGGIPRWFVKAIVHQNDDLMDRPVTFAPGQHLRGVEVVMTDKLSELIFHVTDDRGLPTRDYVGLVFSIDQAKWNADNFGRYIRTLVPPPETGTSSSATPGDPGANRMFVGGAVPGSSVTAMSTNPSRRQVVAGLPAGEYFAIAVDDLEVDGYRDPQFLEELSRRAARVTIADGART